MLQDQTKLQEQSTPQPTLVIRVLPDGDFDFDMNVDVTTALSMLSVAQTKLGLAYLQNVAVAKQAELAKQPSILIPNYAPKR